MAGSPLDAFASASAADSESTTDATPCGRTPVASATASATAQAVKSSAAGMDRAGPPPPSRRRFRLAAPFAAASKARAVLKSAGHGSDTVHTSPSLPPTNT